MTLFGAVAFDGTRHPREIAPGAVHLPGWLTPKEQVRFAAAFDQWSGTPVPIRAAMLPGGHRMSVETVCLGWHWRPYRYSRIADDVNGRRVRALPGWLAEHAAAAVSDAYGDHAGAEYRPDAALVNYYGHSARLGMHKDNDELVDEPVVSFSVGDSCIFRFGNADHRGKPYTDTVLNSGDVVVFGRASRYAFYGVPKILPHSAPHGCGVDQGRINITVRVTGMIDQ
jgi:alkylated DNA repair protein (DNA oxidative demethylase)